MTAEEARQLVQQNREQLQNDELKYLNSEIRRVASLGHNQLNTTSEYKENISRLSENGFTVDVIGPSDARPRNIKIYW